jgi:hypothetical protein
MADAAAIERLSAERFAAMRRRLDVRRVRRLRRPEALVEVLALFGRPLQAAF